MKYSAKTHLLVLIVAAFLFDYLPYVNLPLRWTETFFHEISHGLAALLTGGDIVSISIRLNGAGMCVSRGGLAPLVSFAGYAGSAWWGAMMYLSVAQLRRKYAHLVLAVLIVLLLLSVVLWVRDLVSAFIMSGMIAMYALVWFKRWLSVRVFMQFVAIFVMLDAVRSPLYLLDGANRGDGARLADITYIPELIWVVVWTVISLASLVFVYRLSERRSVNLKTGMA